MRKKSKLTLVFDEIWSFLKQHENLKFDALYSKLEITQFKSKAYYDIQCSFDDKTIEIFQHGILPIIWIQ